MADGIRASGLPRDAVFVTTKLWNDDQGYDSTLRAFDASLKRLGLDYVDLYLLHWPVAGKRLDSWRALERLHAEKRARAIGVSNFLLPHLRGASRAREGRAGREPDRAHAVSAAARDRAPSAASTASSSRRTAR